MEKTIIFCIFETMKDKIYYERTWCDFLTPCPHGKNCLVGDYDCSICKCFNGYIDEEPLNVGEYFKVIKGSILCNYAIEKSDTN